MVSLDLTDAQVLTPDGLVTSTLTVADGLIQADRCGRSAGLHGYYVLPGIVDLHGDAFERHVAPRRGAMTDIAEGIVSAEAELAANGITTAVLAQFASWEGGLRSPEFARTVFTALRDTAPGLATDMRGQLRLETHLLEVFDDLPAWLAEWGVRYVVLNDHLPHRRLAEGRTPARLTGQALKAGRNPAAHLDLMQRLHARTAEVPQALDDLCRVLQAQGVRLGSHDDADAAARETWARRGVEISEFPETLDAARAARVGGATIVMGAPNVVRGGSHNANVSAETLVREGLCDALASDYHYPSPRRAALALVRRDVADFATAWRLVSEGPARALGLSDRGCLAPGLRADLVILDAETGRVAATLAGGRFSYLSGAVAERILG